VPFKHLPDCFVARCYVSFGGGSHHAVGGAGGWWLMRCRGGCWWGGGGCVCMCGSEWQMRWLRDPFVFLRQKFTSRFEAPRLIF
jgi:hypothetical protein